MHVGRTRARARVHIYDEKHSSIVMTQLQGFSSRNWEKCLFSRQHLPRNEVVLNTHYVPYIRDIMNVSLNNE